MQIDRMDLYNKALFVRNRLGEDNSSPIDIFSIVMKIPDVSLVRIPLGSNISGVCIKMRSSAVIGINSECSKGRQNFTLAHELYHYYFSDAETSNICPFTIDKKDPEEYKADSFASFLLLPGVALSEMISGSDIDLKKIIEIEQIYGLSHKALLTRLVMDRYLNASDCRKFESNIIQNAMDLGYSPDLYLKTEEYGTYGYYVKKVNELHEKKKISSGKKDELLYDALRGDLVDGYRDEGRFVVD
jgi:Zn-dependent peptidase ImmA (M78 family)